MKSLNIHIQTKTVYTNTVYTFRTNLDTAVG